MRLTFAPDHPGVSQRLSRNAFDGAACRAAIRGEKLPSNLGNHVVRLCLVHGIRHHISFARSPEVTELAALAGQEMFARARNARLIMSGEIPSEDTMHAETYPYCIWHPTVAKEETYRALAQRYPAMRYQVGRACAAAGYTQLYRELGLLPDVAIAEEARENRKTPGARQIFEAIMATPVRYRVMDDSTRTINVDKPEAPACLNADTAVLATLAARHKYSKSFDPDDCSLDITEDCGIDEEIVELKPPVLSPEDAALLNGPLSFDLPSMNKTLLILCAAITGNVDRYARLRRRDVYPPSSRVYDVRFEMVCLTRGCYHSTAMATWLAKSPDVVHSLKLNEKERVMLWRGIHARRIMDGVWSHLADPSDVPDAELPYWIWHPTLPHYHVLEALARARPAMRPHCVRACIAADYRDVYDSIMGMEPTVTPDRLMMDDAKASANPYYREDLLRCKERLGLTHLGVCANYANWMDALPMQNPEPQLAFDSELPRDTQWELHNPGESEYDYGFYDGFDVSMEGINLFLSSPDEYKRRKLGLGKK
jgi:hypothetical protein